MSAIRFFLSLGLKPPEDVDRSTLKRLSGFTDNWKVRSTGAIVKYERDIWFSVGQASALRRVRRFQSLESCGFYDNLKATYLTLKIDPGAFDEFKLMHDDIATHCLANASMFRRLWTLLHPQYYQLSIRDRVKIVPNYMAAVDGRLESFDPSCLYLLFCDSEPIEDLQSMVGNGEKTGTELAPFDLHQNDMLAAEDAGMPLLHLILIHWAPLNTRTETRRTIPGHDLQFLGHINKVWGIWDAVLVSFAAFSRELRGAVPERYIPASRWTYRKPMVIHLLLGYIKFESFDLRNVWRTATSLRELYWQRRRHLTRWLAILQKAGVDLEAYGRRQLRKIGRSSCKYDLCGRVLLRDWSSPGGFRSYHVRIESIITGARPEDWRVIWDADVERFAGQFWEMIKQSPPQSRMPGEWATWDDDTEDSSKWSDESWDDDSEDPSEWSDESWDE
jgi:hypothetical protein